MGTLTNFRKISPYALGLFVIVFVGFMVLSDSDISSLIKKGQTMQNAVLGKVNGEEITYKEYEEKFSAQVEQERAQSQNPDAEIDQVRIHQQIWNQLVDNILINQQAKKMGIKVTPEEIRDELIENPPDYLKKSFTDSAGNFMREVYLELVTNPESYVKYLGADPSKMSEEEKQEAVNRLRKDLMEIEDYIVKSKVLQNVQRAVGVVNSFVSPNYATQKLILENSFYDLKIIAFRPTLIKKEDIKVSNEEIKKYYDEHKQYYEQKAQAKLKYVIFPIQPSSDDSARAARNLKDITDALMLATTPEARDSVFEIKFSEYGGETKDYTPINQVDSKALELFKGMPDKSVIGPIPMSNSQVLYRLNGRRSGVEAVVKASHILIKIDNNKDSALAIANSILKQAKSGSDFAELAKLNSQDPGSAMNGGDLGYFGKGQMVAPFEEAAFAANAGDIVGPIETQFGYHIIKVVDKVTEELSYSTITISTTISNTTKNQILRDAYSIMKQAESGENFDTLVARIKKTATETTYFTKERPIFNSWYLTNAAFGGEVGQIIEPLELKYYGVILAQITGIKQAGIAPLEDKKEEITQILIKHKQLQMLKNQVNSFYQKLQGMTDLEQARAMDSSIQVIVANQVAANATIPGLTKDPVLMAKLLKANNGINAPILGENGYYIVQVSNKNIANAKSVKPKLKDMLKQLSNTDSQNAFYQWYQKVKEDADIEDLRNKFYKEY